LLIKILDPILCLFREERGIKLQILNKRTVGILFVSILILCSLTTILPVSAKSSAIDVYSGNSIQTAIDKSSTGGTVYVHSGTYHEKIRVSKQLTLLGDNAILDLDGLSFPNTGTPAEIGNAGIFVEAGGVTVKGFTIKNIPPYIPSGSSGFPFVFGIRFYGCFSGGNIQSNIVDSNYNGIGVMGAFLTTGVSNVEVKNNMVTAPGGIAAYNAPNVDIENNVISATVNTNYPSFSPVGMIVSGDYSYSGIKIENNLINSEGWGIRVNPPNPLTLKTLEIKNNQIQASKNGIDIASSSGLVSNGDIVGNKILSNGDGIYLGKAKDFQIKNNNIQALGGAVSITEGSDITVKNNVLNAEFGGIGCGFNTQIISSVSDGEFSGNEIHSNYLGIALDYLEDVTIKDNTVYSQFHGIVVSAGPNNKIKSNEIHTTLPQGDSISLGIAPLGWVSDSCVEDNEIYAGAQQVGITLNNVADLDIKGNTVYSSYQGIVVAPYQGAASYPNSVINIKGNVLHSINAGIRVLAGVTNVVIKGNGIYSDNFGIQILSAQNIEVKGNTVYASIFAIDSMAQLGIIIKDNVLDASRMGIWVRSANSQTIPVLNPQVTGNSIRSSNSGIFVTNGNGATVQNNKILISNLVPWTGAIITFNGIAVSGTNNDVVSNTVSGDFTVGISARRIPGPQISTSINIIKNVVTGGTTTGDIGILLDPYTYTSTVAKNIISGVDTLILDQGIGNTVIP
jgi:parallel beta-helix repeat protein